MKTIMKIVSINEKSIQKMSKNKKKSKSAKL